MSAAQIRAALAVQEAILVPACLVPARRFGAASLPLPGARYPAFQVFSPVDEKDWKAGFLVLAGSDSGTLPFLADLRGQRTAPVG